jgi:signal transduction histidine kinase
MIKKLQRKFVLITMGSLVLVMVFLVGVINVVNVIRMEVQNNKSLNIIAENQGKFPEFKKDMHSKIDGDPIFGFEINPETQYEKRYFVIEMSSDGTINNIDTGHIAAISSSDAQDYATKVMDNGKESGYEGIYKYMIVEQTDGYMIVFMDCRNQIQTELSLLVISSAVALATLVLMFILVSILSKKAMKPFIENAEKQKLFITDAGHEIKTPLAIISANADVLELTGGESEWITSIRNQTVRLDKLVKNLLTLSKMDEENVKLTFAEFDLSETVAKISESFIAVAESKNKKFLMDIQPGIRLHGDEGSMEQLVSTLVDNAMKYSSEEGMIRLKLATGKKGPKLEVYNTVDHIEVDNLDKLFDRFYRADASRARDTGGYGIGLSIAKSIVEAHHGRISVKSEDSRSICFTIQF